MRKSFQGMRNVRNCPAAAAEIGGEGRWHLEHERLRVVRLLDHLGHAQRMELGAVLDLGGMGLGHATGVAD